MALTPVEIRHIQLKRSLFGYRKAAVHRMMDDIADSFENVWRERSQLVERVEELETEVTRHVELEGLLRSALAVVDEAPAEFTETADATVTPTPGEQPGWTVETRTSQPAPVIVQPPPAADESEEIRELAG